MVRARGFRNQKSGSQEASGRVIFHALGTPSCADVASVVAGTAARIEKILRQSGRSLDAEMQEQPPELCDKQLGLAACYAAAAQGVSVSGDRAGLPPLRLIVSADPKLPTDGPADSSPKRAASTSTLAKLWTDATDDWSGSLVTSAAHRSAPQ